MNRFILKLNLLTNTCLIFLILCNFSPSSLDHLRKIIKINFSSHLFNYGSSNKKGEIQRTKSNLKIWMMTTPKLDFLKMMSCSSGCHKPSVTSHVINYK